MYILILLLPLFATLLAMPARVYFGARATEVLTTTCVGLSAFIAWILFFNLGNDNQAFNLVLFNWLSSGNLIVNWSMNIDRLSSIMMVVICTVSFLVHVYSIGYMHEDKERGRFFLCLSLFTFAMLALVTADNFIQLFFGWEGVGLASYLLIGFWRHKDSANNAAIKAFVVNRVGDFGLVIGIMSIFTVFQDLSFANFFHVILSNQEVLPIGYAQAVPIKELYLSILGFDVHALSFIALMLFMGAMGKSAQFFLHTWLPDAMEGPTPVSALIHAATMVTAGVFLICRLSPLYESTPDVKLFITLIGAITALFAASVALFQTDIKKIIAYSTCSQLGYMFVACGLGAYDVAMFHLFTHAFFKAMLFLGAGIVIVGTHHEQNILKMGGVKYLFPLTYVFMFIGTAAITGIGLPLVKLFDVPIGFAGFVSKDLIIEHAYSAVSSGNIINIFAFGATVFAVILTAFYSWRLIYLTFLGKSRLINDIKLHPHPIPQSMIYSIIPLAFGAVFSGMVFYQSFTGKNKDAFWASSIYQNQQVHLDNNNEHSSSVKKISTTDYLTSTDFLTSQDKLNALIQNNIKANYLNNQQNTAHTNIQKNTHDKPQTLQKNHVSQSHTNQTLKNTLPQHDIPLWVFVLPFLAMILGTFIAVRIYGNNNLSIEELTKAKQGKIKSFLFNSWYFDKLYDFIFVKNIYKLANFLWKFGDEKIIDGLGPNGISILISKIAKRIVKLQSGFIFHYALGFIIGLTILLFIIWFNFFSGIN